MHRNEQNIVPLIKGPLSRISVVDIPIKNCHFFHTFIKIESVIRSHSHTVEEAKSAEIVILARVVPWRSHSAKSLFPVRGQNQFYRFHQGCNAQFDSSKGVAVEVGVVGHLR